MSASGLGASTPLNDTHTRAVPSDAVNATKNAWNMLDETGDTQDPNAVLASEQMEDKTCHGSLLVKGESSFSNGLKGYSIFLPVDKCYILVVC